MSSSILTIDSKFHRTVARLAFMVAAAATATSAAMMVFFDANPTLYMYEMLTSSHLRRKKFQSSLCNKRIWIVGSSSGIGAELAVQLFSVHGARLILSSRNENALLQVKDQCMAIRRQHSNRWDQGSMHIPEQGDGYTDHNLAMEDSQKKNEHKTRIDFSDDLENAIHVLPLDVTSDENDIVRTVQHALTLFNGIDILVLNSGIGQLSSATHIINKDGGGLKEITDTTQRLMDVNFLGPVRLAMEIIRQDSWGQSSNYTETQSDYEENRKEGHIVVISSVAGKMAVPLCTSYAASKHALHGFFNSLRSECSPWLRCDLICPGPVRTEFQRKINNHDGVDTSKTRNFDRSDPPNDDGDSEGSNSVMPVDRCVQLITASMRGRPSILFHESWIARQPTLTFLYLNQHFPVLSTALLGLLGAWRKAAWEMGLPLYKVSSWIKAARAERGKDASKDRPSSSR